MYISYIVQSTLLSLFFISEKYLNKDECSKLLGPLIKLLFQLNDRAIRGILLQKIYYIETILDNDILNIGVFEPMCSGFSDSSSALRELTLKATLILVPHLTHPNLEKLARYLIRLQNDDEHTIRTNTVIFFSKLAPYLTETTRSKMLLPVFIRAMKDPYTPCRNASIQSILKIKELFTPDNIAVHVLPSITPRLLDPSNDVRIEALKAVDELLLVLKQESERLSMIELQQQQLQAQQQQAPRSGGVMIPPGVQQQPQQQQVPMANATKDNKNTASAPTSSGWGITSIFGGSSKTGLEVKATTLPMGSSVQQPPSMMVQQEQHPPQSMMPPITSYGNTTTITSGIAATNLDDNWSDDEGLGDDANDGWGDEDDLTDLNTTKLSSSKTMVPGAAPISGNSSLFSPASINDNIDNDEFFDAFEAKPTTNIIKTNTMIKKPVGKLTMPTKKAVAKAPNSGGLPKLGTTTISKPSITKLNNKDDVADGWDDF